jgi:hypothetical protein
MSKKNLTSEEIIQGMWRNVMVFATPRRRSTPATPATPAPGGCKPSQELIGTQCRKKCAPGQIRSGASCKNNPADGCPAGQKKDSKKGCIPDQFAQCPAGEHHDGKKCVAGAAESCGAGKEYSLGKCVTTCKADQERFGGKCYSKCPTGLVRRGSSSTCIDSQESCPDGAPKHPRKGCGYDTNGNSYVNWNGMYPPITGAIVPGLIPLALNASLAYNLPVGGEEALNVQTNNLLTAKNGWDEMATPGAWLGVTTNENTEGDETAGDEPYDETVE